METLLLAQNLVLTGNVIVILLAILGFFTLCIFAIVFLFWLDLDRELRSSLDN